MSNKLTIRIVEIRDLGATEAVIGYIAMDDESESVYEVSRTVEGFREEFPSVRSLVDYVLTESAFSHLNIQYKMVNGYPEVTNEDDDFSAHISLPNIETVYS